ncbi:pro-resilin-like [Chrysoperla carnea]|uniref:pro-resilin-like n=1 Tax=Chrysoperla carnea TaxID=189513 RepID=UPI001D05D7F5|nr:pro-resilin-like [Chrysoperla carnea]
MKIFVSLFTLLVISNCEPPVPNNPYLRLSKMGLKRFEVPMLRRGGLGSYGVPNQSYGLPRQNNDIPRPQYGPPEQNSESFGYAEFNSDIPSQSYGVPNANSGVPRQAYGPPRAKTGASRQANRAPNVNGGAPRQSFGAPNVKSGAPRQSLGGPKANSGSLSQSYGVPEFNNAPVQSSRPSKQNRGTLSTRNQNNGIPSQSYGPPIESIRAPNQNYGIPEENNDIPNQSYGVPNQFFESPVEFNDIQNDIASQLYAAKNVNSRSPSQSYGVPSANSGGQNGVNKPAPFRPTVNSPPPSQSYGPPVQFVDIPNESYNPLSVNSVAPSQSYGVPDISTIPIENSGLSESYGFPSANSGPSSQSFGVPRANSGTVSPKGNSIGQIGGNKPTPLRATRPSSTYGPPPKEITPSITIRSNIEYGMPSSINQQPNNAYLPPSGQELGTGGNTYSHGENNGDELSEPANYDFEYMVSDPPSGNDFGHKESRQGDETQGSYYAALPDGRRLIVDYRADKNGYQPNVRYEGEAKFPTPTSSSTNQDGDYSLNDASSGGYESNDGFDSNNDGTQDGYVY